MAKFYDSSDSEDDNINLYDSDDSDFEGFQQEDIAHLGKTLKQISMNDFIPENDKDLESDIENGWSQDPSNSPPLNAPFTGEHDLKVDMEEKKSLPVFQIIFHGRYP